MTDRPSPFLVPDEDGWIDTVRSAVSPDMCDPFGHMNVMYYMGAVNDAMYAVLAAIGLTADRIAAERLGMVAVRMELDYLAELRVGDTFAMRSRLTGGDAKKIHVEHVLHDVVRGRAAMRCLGTALAFDLDARKTRPLPDDMAAKIDALVAAAS